MDIMVLAPQPFFQERGTPIAVDWMVRGYCARGHEVHLFVFHEGADVAHNGLTIHRTRAWKGLDGIGPGLSFRKLIADVLMFVQAIRWVRRKRPDAIHAVEEGVFMAFVFWKLFGIPYVYDMDSSMPDQIVEKLPFLRPLRGLFWALLRPAIHHAHLVAPVCDDLARRIDPCRPRQVVVLRDISLVEDAPIRCE
jgi:hypothetical protein